MHREFWKESFGYRRANLALNVTGKPKEPGLFDEAYNNPNLEEEHNGGRLFREN
jgi:hypothetical protein